MRTERALVLVALVVGCGPSRRDDLDSMRAILATRAELEIADREPAAWQEGEPAVREILAQPLGVEDAVRVALLNNRDLRAAIYELGIARGELVQAGVLPNPTVHMEGRFSEDPAHPMQLDFGAAIDLTGIILGPIRAHAAGARLEAARFRTAGDVLDLSYRVRLAFFRYQASAQRLELMRTAQESFVASVEAARALREAGNVRDLDVALEEAALEEARIATARAELEMLDDRERLNVLLGLHGSDVTWEVAGRMPDPSGESASLEELEPRAIEASLELAWTRAELEAIGRSIGVARAEALIPDIEIGFHAELDAQHWELGPEVTVGVPIFSAAQGTVAAREAQLDAVRERYVGIAIAVRASVRAARNRAITTELLARRYREVLLPARERVFEQTLLQYNAMQLDVFRLLQARREQIEAASDYLDALRDHWSAQAALEQILAGRLAGTIGGGDGATPDPARSPRARGGGDDH